MRRWVYGYVGIDKAVVDYQGNCGNISLGVGPFAVDEGLVAPIAAPRQMPVEPIAYTEPQTTVTTTWRLKNLSARDFESKLADQRVILYQQNSLFPLKSG